MRPGFDRDGMVRTAMWLLPATILLFLAVFAWRFADERLYGDSGYYLAHVINEGAFRIEHGRCVLALSQVLPLIGVKLRLDMSTLIMLHSLNNVVWLLACMLFAWRVLHNTSAVVALACAHLIGLTHGLFCPIFELYYGVDLLILFVVVYRSDRLSPKWRWALLTTLLIGVLSSHFFAVVLLGGVLALERAWRNRVAIVVFGAITVAFILLRILDLSAYEADGIATLAGALNTENLAYLFSPTHLIELLTYSLRHYVDVIVLAAIVFIAMLRSQQKRTAMLFASVALALLVLSILYRAGPIHDRYREQVNFALVAWVVLVFCTQLLHSARWRMMGISLLITASLFRMVRAEWIAPWYTERTNLIETRIALAHEHHMRKAIVHAPVFFGPPHHLIDLSWSTSVESLLLSAKAGPDATVSLITTEDLELPEVRTQLDAFIFRRWDILDPGWLDDRYFSAPTGRYVPLPGDPIP